MLLSYAESLPTRETNKNSRGSYPTETQSNLRLDFLTKSRALYQPLTSACCSPASASPDQSQLQEGEAQSQQGSDVSRVDVKTVKQRLNEKMGNMSPDDDSSSKVASLFGSPPVGWLHYKSETPL